MKIVPGQAPPDIQINEMVIRTVEYTDEEGEKKQAPHFQAKIKFNKENASRRMFCDISYYSPEGEFLGLDKYDSEFDEHILRENFPLSMPLQLPKQAETARINISHSRHHGFYYWIGRVISLLFVLLLISWIFKILVG